MGGTTHYSDMSIFFEITYGTLGWIFNKLQSAWRNIPADIVLLLMGSYGRGHTHHTNTAIFLQHTRSTLK